MSLWKIAWRSIQQRGVASSLTTLSMALGVMLVVVVLSIHGIVSQSFQNNSSLGYNMIIGPKGGALQLTLNTVYYLSSPIENIPYDFYLEFLPAEKRRAEREDSIAYRAHQAQWHTAQVAGAAFSATPGLQSLTEMIALDAARQADLKRMGHDQDGSFAPLVDFAIPLCLGDFFGNFRVVGTTPAMFEDLVYDLDRERKYTIAPATDWKTARKAYQTADKNDDGQLSDEELDRNGDGMVDERDLAEDQLKDIRRILHLADKDHDLRLTDAEFEGCVQEFPRHFKQRSDQFGFFEAVVGSTVARRMDVKVGQQIAPAHGEPGGHTHQRLFTVVGILEPTGTPNDRAVFVNMEGFFLMSDHSKPIERFEDEGESQDGGTVASQLFASADAAAESADSLTRLPLEQREVTSMLVRTKSPLLAPGMETMINKGGLRGTLDWSSFRPKRNQVSAQAVLPVGEIFGLFRVIITPVQTTLLVLTGMICLVSGISILVSIYNSMSERKHEIAVMRALGAGRLTVMTVILLESIFLSLGGGLLGWVGGHALNALASPWVDAQTGVSIGLMDFAPPINIMAPINPDQMLYVWPELLLIPSLISLAVIVGFLPALSAYRTDVARCLGK